MRIDVDRVRRETPGCAQVVHFNNAGASLMPRPVLDALVGHLHLEARIGGYEAADRAAPEIDHVYDALARLLNARPNEIAFVENATRAWDMAFYSMRLGRGDRILTGMAEYASNYIAFLQVASRTGAVVEAVANDEHGQISIDALRRAIDGRVKLIALTHVPTNGGLVNPAAAVGRVAREARIPYLLDACQSVGQMPVDVEAIGCDMLSGTGRKYLRGPRATGFLYVSRALLDRLEPPFLDVHAAGYLTQTVGLTMTSPGNSGLITGLFVVFTPLIDRFFGVKLRWWTLVAVAAALAGTGLLVGGPSGVGLGDVLTIACAFLFGLHIVLLSHWSPGLRSAPLAMVQMGSCALIFSAGGSWELRMPSEGVWIAIVITGVFASALAFYIQTWAQQHLSASRTALILTTEPAWAVAAAVILAGQRFGELQAAGAALVLAAIVGHELAHLIFKAHGDEAKT